LGGGIEGKSIGGKTKESKRAGLSRSGVSAERRRLKLRRMAALCRDAATPKFGLQAFFVIQVLELVIHCPSP